MENFIFCAVQKMMVVSKYKQRSKTKKYICVTGLDSCSSTCFNYPLNLEFCFRRLFLTKILVLRTIMEVFCKTLNGNITIEIEPELFLLISTSYCNFVRLFQVESLLEYFRTFSEFFSNQLLYTSRYWSAFNESRIQSFCYQKIFDNNFVLKMTIFTLMPTPEFSKCYF